MPGVALADVADRHGARNPGIVAGRLDLFAPVDIAPLVLLRIAFGAVMLWEIVRYFANGWIRLYYVEPSFHFRYYGFEWVHPWPGAGMHVHFALLGVCAACIMLGLFYRVAAALFCAGFTYVFLLEQARYLNHFYLICLLSFLLAVLPAHRDGSLDAWRRPALRATHVPAWMLWLARLQVGVPYFYGGLAKLGVDWLHGEPLRTWLAGDTGVPLIGRFFERNWMIYALSYGGLLLDLLVVPLLLWRRTRVWAFGCVVLFHLMNARLFHIGVFPWLMLLATLVFFPPETLRRVFFGWRASVRSAAAIPPAPAPRGSRRGTLVALGAYAALQLLLPLRHFLYPGNVDWTEEGHRFSWHMKLRDKTAHAVFVVNEDGGSREVAPAEYLTSWQESKMAGRPDMILQFAHHLAERSRADGHRHVEVRALAFASLNGGPWQPLLDPEVDLARVQRSLGAASWILPPAESRD